MSGSRRASTENVGRMPNAHSDGSPREESDDAHLSSEHREAMDYWGTLIQKDRTASEKLEGLLLGIARYIAQNIDPYDCEDLTPAQLAEFYRRIGGDYDVLFDKTGPRSISFIYKSIGCLHSLQPSPTSSGFDLPEVPALKPKGFVRWQTVQLLLGPEEHVPFLQAAVKQFEIVDKDGTRIPDVLPKECFPEGPDERMLQWYQQVSENLKREAQTPGGGSGIAQSGAQRPPSIASTLSSTDGYDEHSSPPDTGPASFPPNSTHRDPRERPMVARQGSRDVRDDRLDSGARHVRGNQSLQHARRSGFTRQYSDGSGSSEDETVLADTLTPTGMPIRRHPRSPLAKSSRIDSISSTNDDGYDNRRDQDRRRSSRSPSRNDERIQPIPRKSPTSAKRLRPELRYRRSHDQPSTSGHYFDHQDGGIRRHSVQGQQGGFAPSKAPPFAAQVAAAQLRSSYTQATPVSRYTNEAEYLRPSSGRYGSETSLGRRERERERERDRDRDRGRKTRPSYEKTNGSGERFYEDDDADQRRRGRSSEDRNADREWERIGRDGERERSISDRERDRDRDRDRDRRGGPAHRYVAPVGVGGRRYPPETWK